MFELQHLPLFDVEVWIIWIGPLVVPTLWRDKVTKPQLLDKLRFTAPVRLGLVVICLVWSGAAWAMHNIAIKWPTTPHGFTPGCKRRAVIHLFLVDFIFPVSFIHCMWHIKRLYFGIKDTILQHIGKLICFSQLVLCPNMNPQGQTRVYRLRENEPQQQVAFCCLMNTAICCYHCYAFHQTIRQLSM